MAMRKNNSRQSDRNRIFKMDAQGYSIAQIEAALSITSQHITYILTQYENDLRARRAASPELQARAKIQEEVEGRRKVSNAPANDPAMQEIKDQLRKEIMAELGLTGGEKLVVPQSPSDPIEEPVDPEPEPELEAPLVLETPDALETPEPRAKPRRKTAKKAA